MKVDDLTSTHLPQRLLAAPLPLPQESRSSLVQRLCGSHQYSFVQLSKVTGLKPRYWDWDAGLSKADWQRLCTLSGWRPESCGEAIYAIDLLCHDFGRSVALLYGQGHPYYRWCTRCLATDETPYWRWDWRLKGASHCYIHQLPLTEKCEVCGSLQLSRRAVLVSSGSYPGAVNLATCQTCGISLLAGGALAQHADRCGFDGSCMKQVLTLLKTAYQQGAKTVKLDDRLLASAIRGRPLPGDCLGSSWTRHDAPSDWSGLVFGSKYARQKSEDGSRVQGSKFNHSANQPRKKWSLKLASFQRKKLAKALVVIRAEINAMRREAAKANDLETPRGFE